MDTVILAELKKIDFRIGFLRLECIKMNNELRTKYENPNYINDFSEIYEQYEKIYGKKITDETKSVIDRKKVIIKFSNELDKIFFEALRFYHNMNCVLFFGLNNKTVLNRYYEHFNQYFKLYGIKKIIFENLNHKKSFIYQIYSSKIKTIQDLNQYVDYYENVNHFYVLVLQSNLQENLVFKNYLKKSKNVYFCDNLCKKFVLNTLIFNSSTLNVMKTHDIEYIIQRQNSISFEYLNKYRNWIMNYIDIRDHHIFMLFSSIVLFIYGIREVSDLDLFISDTRGSCTDNIVNMINDAFILKNDKFRFVDASIKNTSKWKCYQDEWFDEWANLSGATCFNDILVNGDYHFYFCGVKMINLHSDIVRRIKRNRPRSIADLYMINRKLHYDIRIPEFPKYREEYKDITEDNIAQIKTLLRTNKNAKLTEDKKQVLIRRLNDMDKHMQTIQWWLSEKYDMDTSTIELKNELGY